MDKTRLTWTSSLLVAAVTLAGCFDRTNAVNVQLIKSNSCGTGPDPMADVTHMRVRFINATRCGQADSEGKKRCQVSNGECNSDADCGLGTSVLEKVVAKDTGTLSFEAIPAGTPLAVQVAGFASAPPDGRLVAFGQSGQFIISTDKVDAPAAPTVFFRPVDKFSPVVLASDPTVCTQMTTPRAGHTATVLDDGRVLLAGGFDTTGISAGNVREPTFWAYRETVEVFDPTTGAITTDAPPMQTTKAGVVQRAFHTATKLPSNQVLIAGGEFVKKTGTLRALTTAFDSTMLFDPTISDADTGTAGGWVTQPSAVKRSGHVAVTETSGKVLFYGGLYWDGTSGNVPAFGPSGSFLYEWYDPDVNVFSRLETASSSPNLTAFGQSGLAILNGKYIAIAGGGQLDIANVGKANKDRAVRFYQYSTKDSKFTEAATAVLPVPRSFLSFAGAPSATRYLLIGGFTAFDATKWWDRLPGGPYNGTDILNLKNGTPTIIPGPTIDVARGHACSVTLNDGRILIIGGRGGATTLGSLANTGTFTDNGNADPAAAFTFDKGSDLTDARFFHTCTLLSDGSVLVTGGVQEKGADFKTLSSMEIFVPAPASTK